MMPLKENSTETGAPTSSSVPPATCTRSPRFKHTPLSQMHPPLTPPFVLDGPQGASITASRYHSTSPFKSRFRTALSTCSFENPNPTFCPTTAGSPYTFHPVSLAPQCLSFSSPHHHSDTSATNANLLLNRATGTSTSLSQQEGSGSSQAQPLRIVSSEQSETHYDLGNSYCNTPPIVCASSNYVLLTELGPAMNTNAQYTDSTVSLFASSDATTRSCVESSFSDVVGKSQPEISVSLELNSDSISHNGNSSLDVTRRFGNGVPLLNGDQPSVTYYEKQLQSTSHCNSASKDARDKLDTLPEQSVRNTCFTDADSCTASTTGAKSFPSLPSATFTPPFLLSPYRVSPVQQNASPTYELSDTVSPSSKVHVAPTTPNAAPFTSNDNVPQLSPSFSAEFDLLSILKAANSPQTNFVNAAMTANSNICNSNMAYYVADNSASALYRIPEGFPKDPPAIVMGEWTHGQLVWWNRFLANRKRSQGTSVGNYIGRVVDLESEWFPGRDLLLTRGYLKTVTAGMGRRILVVQSLGEMRYMAIPPRSIVATFTNSPEQEPLLEGLRQSSSLSALRGLRRAEFILAIRSALEGRQNSLLEIEFLALCLDSSVNGQHCSQQELDYLKSVTVWEFMRAGNISALHNAGGVTSSPVSLAPQIFPDCTTSILSNSEKVKRRRSGSLTSHHVKADVLDRDHPNLGHKKLNNSADTFGVECCISARKDHDENVKGEHDEIVNGDHDENVEELSKFMSGDTAAESKPTTPPANNVPARRRMAPYRKDLRRRSRIELNIAYNGVGLTAQSFSAVRDLVKTLCLRYSDLTSLLRGIPLTLLANRTTVSLPEELPEYSIKILEQVLTLRALASQGPMCYAGGRAMALHICIANAFLHQLYRTIAIRVCIQQQPNVSPADQTRSTLTARFDSSATTFSPPVATEICHSVPIPSAAVTAVDPSSNPASSTSSPCTTEIQPSFNSNETIKKLCVVFSLTHTHQSHRHCCFSLSPTHATTRLGCTLPSTRKPAVYKLKNPFRCALVPFIPVAKRLSPSSTTPHTTTSPMQSSLTPVHREENSLQPNTSSCVFQNEAAETSSPSFVSHLAHQRPSETCYRSTLRLITSRVNAEPQFVTSPGGDSSVPAQNENSSGPRCNVKEKKKTQHTKLFYVKLGMISDSTPEPEEVDEVVQHVMQHPRNDLFIQNLKQRTATLQDLREIAVHLRSIYEDQIAQQTQSVDGRLTADDWKYFEARWAELYRRFKR